MTVPEVGADWDAPEPRRDAPALTYLVCAVPRSGSTMLAEALRRTGHLGVPTEYLNRPVVAGPLRARWGCRTWGEYVAALLRHRTTANGVFGLKAHWNDLVDLTADLTDDAAPRPEAVRRAVEGLLPDLRYVRLTRADRRRAAVSWWIATRTGEWRRDHGHAPAAAPRPAYDRAALEAAAARLDALGAGWDRYFRVTGIEPVRVTYEALVGDHAAAVAAVAAGLGVPVDPADVPPPLTARQADGYTEEVLARWEADDAAGGDDEGARTG